MKFKVGDKVRVKGDVGFYGLQSNLIETVTQVETGGYFVTNSSNYYGWINLFMHEEELELAIPYINEKKLKAKLGL